MNTGLLDKWEQVVRSLIDAQADAERARAKVDAVREGLIHDFEEAGLPLGLPDSSDELDEVMAGVENAIRELNSHGSLDLLGGDLRHLEEEVASLKSRISKQEESKAAWDEFVDRIESCTELPVRFALCQHLVQLQTLEALVSKAHQLDDLQRQIRDLEDSQKQGPEQRERNLSALKRIFEKHAHDNSAIVALDMAGTEENLQQLQVMIGWNLQTLLRKQAENQDELVRLRQTIKNEDSIIGDLKQAIANMDKRLDSVQKPDDPAEFGKNLGALLPDLDSKMLLDLAALANQLEQELSMLRSAEKLFRMEKEEKMSRSKVP